MTPRSSSPSRRQFLHHSALTASTLAAASALPAHAAGGETLRVGLIGCGGRGTGAAGQALNADPDVKLVAIADAFPERLDRCLAVLQRDRKIAGKIDVPPERRFSGLDAYKHVIDSADVVLLC